MLDKLRIKLARWLAPAVFREHRQNQAIIYNLHEMNRCLGKEIPEVKSCINWIFGRAYLNSKDQVWLDKNYEFIEHTYPEATKYPSLVRFKDITVNDYRAKMERK